MGTILFAHAALPATLRTQYELAAPGWRLIPFVSPFPGMSSAYEALTADLRKRFPGMPLLSALLKHLKLEETGPVVFVWFSAGYKMAELLAGDVPSWDQIAAWVGIDGMHSGKDPDGSASDTGVGWLVQLAQGALTGYTVLALGHSDVKTYGGVASTTEVAAEVRRLSNMPDGPGPHGGLLIRPYDLKTNDHDEHIAALREWGAQLLGEAMRLLPRAIAGDLPPAPSEETLGVDVSEHQDPVHTNWAALAGAGVRFAIFRASMGSAGLDKHFQAHLTAVRTTSICALAAYHLYNRERDPLEQVEHFLAALGGEDLAPAVDVEWLGDEGKDGKPLPASTIARVAAGVPTFVREVEQRLHRPCLIYTAPGYAIQIPWPADLGRSPWWACHYNVKAPTIVRPWKDYLIHQKSGGLKTGGKLLAGHEIDQNVFRGTLEALRGALAPRSG